MPNSKQIFVKKLPILLPTNFTSPEVAVQIHQTSKVRFFNFRSDFSNNQMSGAVDIKLFLTVKKCHKGLFIRFFSQYIHGKDT